jgi:hypothetical protein
MLVSATDSYQRHFNYAYACTWTCKTLYQGRGGVPFQLAHGLARPCTKAGVGGSRNSQEPGVFQVNNK